ncbi:MAG: hypothetical protein J6Y94_01075, partial [Bacteriovoracaceae bacterium]|nr:hypothetical protein [Bacteriovoracaceae bacterium]
MTLPFRTLWNVGLVSWLFLASATVIAQEGDISVQDLVGDYYKNIEHSKVLCTFKNLHGVETDCLLNNFPQEQFCQDLAASYAENGELCDAITHGDAPIFAAPTDRRYQEHYAYVTKIAQDVQDRLTKILAAKATPQNAAAIDFLKAHIFKIKDGDLKIATQRDPYNAYSDFTEREIALSIEFVEQIPAVTLTMILAHELGHNISAPYYLGYDAPSLLPAEEVTEGAAGASDPQKAAWQKENERLIKLALAQKNTLENYPFYPELQQYQKLGITGLALIDPAKKDKVYALAKRLAQQ